MAISVKSTAGLASNGVKILVFGPAGAGKTSLVKTLPNPLILSAEAGLLSLAGLDLPYVEIANYEDAEEVLGLLYGDWAGKYESIAIDSLSEIAEAILNSEKKSEKGKKDPRAAYGQTIEKVTDLIRWFRDIPNVNVYMSAKQEKAADELGRISYTASMPGNKMGQGLGYFFDEVMAMRLYKDPESGEVSRMLQTVNDGQYEAKDRSGKLDEWELPDLGAIIRKIGGKS